ncbi:MAG: heavy-metal-associated domain-containing protein [Anaerolineae bacterium]|nr:heavy-metal-associated domain-containing protein [Anaerolineae bacterium]MDW8099406.1 heavy-metal-associated domain-containing protein [Anaerolineae bacterium]
MEQIVLDIQPISGDHHLEKVVLDVPAMWADHHVLKVRAVLTSLEGVQDVYASSAWKQVLVSFDPSKISQAAIEQALAEAGYPVGAGEVPVLVQHDGIRRDPRWEVLGARVTKTNQVDIEMSGEFRKY